MASRFAVAGSPIAHSLSPVLHRAAISVLGVDATYEAIDVSESQFPTFFTTLDSSFGGLSLTMPLKQVVRTFVSHQCHVSILTGSVNTAVRTPEGWHGFNTDVWGATTALRHHFGDGFDRVIILGGGATASSMVVVAHDMGADALEIVVREPWRAERVAELARQLGMSVAVTRLGDTVASADVLISTLPHGAALSPESLETLDAGALFDVVYNPWPSALGLEWEARGLPTLSGLSMLVFQALRQARIFYGDSVDEQLPDEGHVLTAMRAAVGL